MIETILSLLPAPEMADKINGVFEAIAAALLWSDVRMLYLHKQIRGIWWPARSFFMFWGFWNILYYPSLDQWWSFWAGVALVSANLAWCILAYRYRKN